ncbi:MAG TPA: Rieske 2Fe-2S domain-containing protein [Solirubrobacterales bacterium]|nr:Rieske 2Fe-2S domain-containing protein [Solirubrobacterales bacterium]
MKRIELAIAALLGCSAIASIAFVVIYVGGADTQGLGISLGAALAFLAAAVLLASRRLFPDTPVAEERPEFARPPEDPGVTAGPAAERAEELAGEIESPAEAITRRRLLIAAGGAAGTALGAALVVPVASLGPAVADRLHRSPWRAGLRLVDERDAAVTPAMIGARGFVTAFPEGVDKRELAAPVIVMHLDPSSLNLPPGREGWAPEGLVAYSKICTHAGCAVSIPRSPLYPPRAPRPALVCPCHYSTFDPAKGADVIFGPAGRALPQLPISIGSDGALIAAGELSGDVGPSWRGTRGGT